MRRSILPIMALAMLTLAGLKAAGIWPTPAAERRSTPRELAAAILAPYRTGEAARANVEAVLFTDVAPALGLRFRHDNAARGGYRLPEEMGSGAGFLDFDGDGDLDVFLAGGGGLGPEERTQTCRLFEQTADGVFADATERSGAGIDGHAFGVACADYDGDGHTDIFVSRLGPSALLRNDGAGRFSDVAAAAGVDDAGFGASAAFLDYDRDGDLDLFVTRYVDWTITREALCYTAFGVRDYCNPVVYQAPTADRLYRNRGDGTFEDVSDAAGIAAERGNGLGVVAADFDDDGWLDLYVANDQTPAFLWHNARDGTFENIATVAGCAYDDEGVAIAGMGVTSEDLDADGDADLLVTNIDGQTHLVLRNDDGFFQDVSTHLGLGVWSIPATSFGVALFDQDNDGGLDAFFANGAVNISTDAAADANPYGQSDHFARLIGGRFVDDTARSGVGFDDVGRGAACADYDNDGDLDLLVTNNGGPVRLLRNNDASEHHWVTLDVRSGSRAAIGATVRLTAGGITQRRDVRPQQSYLSSGDHRVHFGLGHATKIERVEIRWPDGSRSTHTTLDVDRIQRLEQPHASGGDAS